MVISFIYVVTSKKMLVLPTHNQLIIAFLSVVPPALPCPPLTPPPPRHPPSARRLRGAEFRPNAAADAQRRRSAGSWSAESADGGRPARPAGGHPPAQDPAAQPGPGQPVPGHTRDRHTAEVSRTLQLSLDLASPYLVIPETGTLQR